MPEKFVDIVNRYEKVIILASLIISMLVFLSISFKSSGRSEKALIDIEAGQTEQNKSIDECRADIKGNKEKQDAVNVSIAAALNRNASTNERIASILSALLIDHAALMKKANLYPHAPMEFNYQQKGRIDSPQAIDDKMKPFPQ